MFRSSNIVSSNVDLKSMLLLLEISEGSIRSMFCVGSLRSIALVSLCSLFRLAISLERRLLLTMILSTLYLEVSKFVTAFVPRNLMAAMSYASAASSCVPGHHYQINYARRINSKAKILVLRQCNALSPPLVDIVLFGLSLLSFLSRFLKHVC